MRISCAKKLLKVVLIFAIILSLIGCEEKKEKFSIKEEQPFPQGLGVSIHTGVSERDIQSIADAGFKWVRVDIFWDRVEKKKGHYDFKTTGYDELDKWLKKRDITPYYILDYSNPIYEKNRSIVTKEGREAFAKFAKVTTHRYKNQGAIWEIWNEPNLGIFWETKPSAKPYTALVKKVAPVIREQDPTGLVVGPAISTLNEDGINWLKEVLKLNITKYIDAVSVHPYRTTSPETVSEDYKKLRTLVNEYSDKDMPIISGEWGYSMAHKDLPLTETQQAKYMARMFLINAQEGIPVSIWYDWKNDGTNLQDKEHNFGLVFNDSTMKLSYLTLQTLTTQLKGYKFDKKINYGRKDNHILEFRNSKGKRILVFWTTGETYKFSYPLEEGEGKLYSMLGGMQNFRWKDKLEFNISSSPSYLVIK